MSQSKLRNVAIIAHVDHGKTTLIDQLFSQSGLFRENQEVVEKLMDSMDQERERGITITSKTGSFNYNGYRVNIIDTPGHADFGGQVERVLHMVDAVLLLVDAVEGPMPQTHFVLKKALSHGLKVIVVINKIDKPSSDCDTVLNEVFDLMVQLDAPDDLLEFPVIYASGRDGYALAELGDKSDSMEPLFKLIVEAVPPPKGDSNAPLQLPISTLSYSPFLGILAIGRIFQGFLKKNDEVLLMEGDTVKQKSRITKLYHFHGNTMKEIDSAEAGDIVAVAGVESISVGQTLTDILKPCPVALVPVDPPTLIMRFLPNNSPFSGQEGTYVSSRHLRERLERAALVDTALKINFEDEQQGFEVAGRGELHLSVLIEQMRREGYEFQVTGPKVIFKKVNGKRLEPYEELTVDVQEEHRSKILKNLALRRGIFLSVEEKVGFIRMKYKIPTRGLLGFKSELMTDTKGLGQMASIFLEYSIFAGEWRQRKNGAVVSMTEGVTTSYALANIQTRSRLFVGATVPLYQGMIIGENSREEDLIVNAAKGKKLTNVRASGSDDGIFLTPPVLMSLEQYLAFINEDELVEITPKNIRLRKAILDENKRKQKRRPSSQ